MNLVILSMVVWKFAEILITFAGKNIMFNTN